jgi:hypothetical protein
LNFRGMKKLVEKGGGENIKKDEEFNFEIKES